MHSSGFLEITIEKVTGSCSKDYQVNQKFLLNGLKTPEKPICSHAYHLFFPKLMALLAGGQFHGHEENCAHAVCPHNAKVVFKIELKNKNEGDFEKCWI